jgi:hypothetical protein
VRLSLGVPAELTVYAPRLSVTVNVDRPMPRTLVDRFTPGPDSLKFRVLEVSFTTNV